MTIVHYTTPMTRAFFSVHGRMSGNRFQPYDTPEYRQARPNEVVGLDGRYWRLVFAGRRFSGNVDVTADVAEYYASLVLEARIKAAHGTVLAALHRLRYGVGSDEATSEDLSAGFDHFVEVL